jgi:hypothetical protein
LTQPGLQEAPIPVSLFDFQDPLSDSTDAGGIANAAPECLVGNLVIALRE